MDSITESPAPKDQSSSAALRLLGLIMLLVAATASSMLVLQHIAGLALPGCGVGSQCAAAAASVWGKIPGIGWPVSHVGCAYFLAMTIAWISTARRGIPLSLAMLARFGLAVSVFYLAIIIIDGHHCIYCIVTHAANAFFWLLLEFIGTAPAESPAPIKVAGVTFVAVTVLLVAGEAVQKESVRRDQEKKLAQSTREIIGATSQETPPPAPSVPVTVAPAPDPKKAPVEKRWPNGFTSRHRVGPEAAPIRIVLLSDYQCPDCQNTEKDITALLARRKDVSVAFKHFPMCTDCNKFIMGANLHPNACWAARAAEAASILYGEEGFWKMHHWLFANKGLFRTDAELIAGLSSLKFEPQQFMDVMKSQETFERVAADVEDGNWLGLHYTPMVFINGVELKGVFTPNAVSRAVDAIAAKNPPALTCENDQPPPATDKLIADWREQPTAMISPAHPAWPLGNPGGRIQIVIWGDLQESNSAQVDGIIRKFMTGRSDVEYSFRHFPVNQSCNPSCQVNKHEKACLAHKAAVAAGLIGGSDFYWKMHEWLFANAAQLSDETLKTNAFQMGLDVNRLLQMMNSPETAQYIESDAALGKRLGLNSIPTIYVNGKFVPRWSRDGVSVLDQILEEAARK